MSCCIVGVDRPRLGIDGPKQCSVAAKCVIDGLNSEPGAAAEWVKTMHLTPTTPADKCTQYTHRGVAMRAPVTKVADFIDRARQIQIENGAPPFANES